MLLTGQATSTGAALVKAGYSPNTAHNPRANSLSAERLIRDAAAVLPQSDRLGDLRPLATKRLRRILEDDAEASGVVAQTALAVHKVANEIRENDDQRVHESHKIAARWMLHRRALLAFAAGVRAGARTSDVSAAIAEVRSRYGARKDGYEHQVTVARLRESETSSSWNPTGGGQT